MYFSLYVWLKKIQQNMEQESNAVECQSPTYLLHMLHNEQAWVCLGSEVGPCIVRFMSGRGRARPGSCTVRSHLNKLEHGWVVPGFCTESARVGTLYRGGGWSRGLVQWSPLVGRMKGWRTDTTKTLPFHNFAGGGKYWYGFPTSIVFQKLNFFVWGIPRYLSKLNFNLWSKYASDEVHTF